MPGKERTWPEQAGLFAGDSGHCIFCHIVAGEARSYRIHEDARTLTFLDLFPATTPGHTLIVTKAHYSDIFSADPADIARVGANSVPLARAVETVTGADGIGIYQFNRRAAGQTVFHYHMHVIPQFLNQRPRIHGREQGDPAALADMAERLSQRLREERARLALDDGVSP